MKILYNTFHLFLLLWLPLNVISQSKEKMGINFFHPNIVDSVAIINSDTILNKSLDKVQFMKLYEESYIDSFKSCYDLEGSMYILNNNKTQYLRVNSKPSDGFWSNYFTIGYFTKKTKVKYLSINIKKFVSHNKIFLGIRESKLIEFSKKSPDCILRKGNYKIIKYYWFNKHALDYLVNKIPNYIASFIFYKNRLIKFGFGEYQAELDFDFFPKGYTLVKGKSYQYN